MMTKRLLLLSALLLAGCGQQTPPSKPATTDYVVQTWPLPAAAGSLAPSLAHAPGDRLLLSWINHREGRRNALQFASYSNAGGWQSQPRTIAVGNALIASAVDVPHMLATADGALWVQWLQSDPEHPEGYDAVLARSRDGGMRWEQITRVNDDGKPAEHGFAALWPTSDNSIGIAWLDGRDTPQGPTQVRANGFDLHLQRGADAIVDPKACDCCRTAVAMTSNGPLLVWRDRSDDQIREIAGARLDNGKWTAPRQISSNHWQLDGCPMNGPAVAAQGRVVVVAWYAETAGKPGLWLARSTDAGDHFAPPVAVAQGPTVLGHADIAFANGQVWVSWLREDQQGQTVMLARYPADLSRQLQRFEVARLQAQGMASGTPSLLADDAAAWLVWTDVADGIPHLKGARIHR